MHENLFWYRNGGLLCMKMFFDTQTFKVCVFHINRMRDGEGDAKRKRECTIKEMMVHPL